MENTQLDHIVITEGDTQKRLDRLLTEHFPTHSRTYFQYLIETGSVLVNGVQVKKREKQKVGDEIEICFILTPEIALEPEDIPLDIIYEDEHFLAINKKAGMVVHPAAGHPSGTFVNALLYHTKKLKEEFSLDLRPGIVHRLDKDTTGILLGAKTLEAHQRLIALFSQRKIEKKYLAISIGSPKEGTLSAPIARHETHRKEMCIDLVRGKEAISEIKILASKENLSLVEVGLITGRTHQIRVHLKHLKTPIAGDPVYGSLSFNKSHGVLRQMLHAHKLTLIHPFTGKELKLEAPIPSDMLELINKSQLNYPPS